MIIRTIEELNEFIEKAIFQAKSIISFGKEVKMTCEIYRKKRSMKQNRYMWAVFENISNFYKDTGFMPDNLEKRLKFFNKDIAKTWYCAKFGIMHTSLLNTKEMVEFLDKVQFEMIEQSSGEYQPIYPDEAW